MKTAVVIPVFNAEKFILHALASAKGQTKEPDHIVVVDDCSTDRSASIASMFKGVQVVSLEANSGSAVARNTGFKLLPDDVDAVLFLDADDILEQDAIATLAEELTNSVRAVAVGGMYRYMDVTGSRLMGISGQNLSPFTQNDVREGRFNPFIPSCTLIRAKTFRQVGGFSEEVRVAEDFELWARLSYHGDLVQTGKLVTRYRIHSSSKSSLYGRQAKNLGLALRNEVPGGRLSRADRASIHYRAAGAAYLNRQPGVAAGRVLAAIALAPKQVLLRLWSQVSR